MFDASRDFLKTWYLYVFTTISMVGTCLESALSICYPRSPHAAADFHENSLEIDPDLPKLTYGWLLRQGPDRWSP